MFQKILKQKTQIPQNPNPQQLPFVLMIPLFLFCLSFLPVLHVSQWSRPPISDSSDSESVLRTSNIRVWLVFAEFANCQVFPMLHKIFRSSPFLNMWKRAPTHRLTTNAIKQYHRKARVLLFRTIKLLQQN